jgi:chemotaxis protein CheY-P-specific phosphatase CheC
MKPEKDSIDRNESEDLSEETTDASADGRRLRLPLETLAVLNWLGDTGIDGVEGRFNQVVGDDLTVETQQVKIGYAERETVPVQFDSDERAGARVPLSSPLKGNALVLFPMESANKAAALMLQRAVDDLSSVSTEMGRDALAELCNMMANGFVDEWATVFETTIDTGSPIAVQDPERSLIHRVLKHYDAGMYITSHLHIPDYDIDGTIYVFPGEERFVTKISKVGLEVIR